MINEWMIEGKIEGGWIDWNIDRGMDGESQRIKIQKDREKGW